MSLIDWIIQFHVQFSVDCLLNKDLTTVFGLNSTGTRVCLSDQPKIGIQAHKLIAIILIKNIKMITY